MARSFEVVTKAAAEILTTSEVKTHLKVDTSADDTLIDNLIKAATESAQIFTNRYFIDTILSQYGDKWSDLDTLFKSPVSGLTRVEYYDTDDVLTTLASAVYTLDMVQQPARIGLNPNQSFPAVFDKLNTVSCTYTVGYGTSASDVPEGIRQATLLTIGNWYENRQNVVVGHSVNELPKSAQYLLEQFKVQTL